MRTAGWFGGSLVALAVLLTMAGATGCRQAPTPPARVLLVSLDTLRPDHLGAYGYERPTSPKLDAFAKGGVVFEDVTSSAPWTLPAHATLFTGLYPSRHGLLTSGAKLADSVATLASQLAASGFVTAAVVNSNYLSRTFGLDRGFQKFRYVVETVKQCEPTHAVTDQALAWLRELGEARWFVFVHYYDAHSDYCSRPEYERQFARAYDGRADGTTAQMQAFRQGQVAFDAVDRQHLVDLYDAGIRQLDDELARLLDAVANDPGVLVVITSDHGEEFFEHGGVLHGRTQYQELVRVPLIMRGPGVPRGGRVATTASLVDVAPTILAATGAPLPANLDGSDLALTWHGGGAELGERYIASEADHNNAEPDVVRAVRHRRHTLHVDRLRGTTTLFDLATDPREQHDRAAAEQDVAADLRAALERLRGTHGSAGDSVTLTPEQIERLRSLGYVR